MDDAGVSAAVLDAKYLALAKMPKWQQMLIAPHLTEIDYQEIEERRGALNANLAYAYEHGAERKRYYVTKQEWHPEQDPLYRSLRFNLDAVVISSYANPSLSAELDPKNWKIVADVCGLQC